MKGGMGDGENRRIGNVLCIIGDRQCAWSVRYDSQVKSPPGRGRGGF